MTKVSRPPYRFDHVGSLLRPEGLLKYREEWKKGELSLEQLRVHEDDCITVSYTHLTLPTNREV